MPPMAIHLRRFMKLDVIEQMKYWALLIIITILNGIDSFCQNRDTGYYEFMYNQPRQVIWGLGVEIQNDAIGSNNLGLPDKVTAIPENLLPLERKRLYKEMLSGFRYCRLAMGLYFRGLDSSGKQMVQRYPGQLAGLKELINESGMEGISMEYWSPAPYWKSTGSFIGGTLRSFEPAFLHQFGQALAKDVQHLMNNGIKVSMWGLQNEALLLKDDLPYSHCWYQPANYYDAFKIVTPYIRAASPYTTIIADSWDAPVNKAADLIKEDSMALKQVDAWAMHRIGIDAGEVIKESGLIMSKSQGKPVLTNEFEYLVEQGAYASDERCLNTAKTIMNWFVFVNSPTWFWLHALKPTYNAEASGFALGFWRPEDDNDYFKFGSIKKGHWDFNDKNFNAIAGFLKYMPWNSVRYEVKEDSIRVDQRILAYKTPENKVVLAFANSGKQPFTFKMSDLGKSKFNGFRYTPGERNRSVGVLMGETLAASVPSLSIEFWIEQ
jgi:hypothetical protein